jgi:hypothetical protein
MIILLIIVLLASLITNIFLIIAIKKAFVQIDTLESMLINFRLFVLNTYKKLKVVDNRGIFEKDDDVGVTFSDIVNLIKTLNKYIQTDDISNDDNKTKVGKDS